MCYNKISLSESYSFTFSNSQCQVQYKMNSQQVVCIQCQRVFLSSKFIPLPQFVPVNGLIEKAQGIRQRRVYFSISQKGHKKQWTEEEEGHLSDAHYLCVKTHISWVDLIKSLLCFRGFEVRSTLKWSLWGAFRLNMNLKTLIEQQSLRWLYRPLHTAPTTTDTSSCFAESALTLLPLVAEWTFSRCLSSRGIWIAAMKVIFEVMDICAVHSNKAFS